MFHCNKIQYFTATRLMTSWFGCDARAYLWQKKKKKDVEVAESPCVPVPLAGLLLLLLVHCLLVEYGRAAGLCFRVD